MQCPSCRLQGATTDCRLPHTLSDLSILLVGGDMPNFVYLNVKCAQYVNMEIFKEQALSYVSSSSPCQLHADHVQMPVSHVPPFVARISVRRWGDLLIFYLILNTYIKRNQFYCARFACLSNRIQFDLLFDLWSSKKARHRIYICIYLNIKYSAKKKKHPEGGKVVYKQLASVESLGKMLPLRSILHMIYIDDRRKIQIVFENILLVPYRDTYASPSQSRRIR